MPTSNMIICHEIMTVKCEQIDGLRTSSLELPQIIGANAIKCGASCFVLDDRVVIYFFFDETCSGRNSQSKRGPLSRYARLCHKWSQLKQRYQWPIRGESQRSRPFRTSEFIFGSNFIQLKLGHDQPTGAMICPRLAALPSLGCRN